MGTNSVEEILAENQRRLEIIHAEFNPITGLNSIGERKLVRISDYPIKEQWLPVTMLENKLIKGIIKAKSIVSYTKKKFKVLEADERFEEFKLATIESFVRIRMRHDFPFWAASFVYIKNKGGGLDVKFKLTRPQRKFVEQLERQRLANKPIRIILLKARQWGGSTTSQLYMAWLQLVHKKGLNSLIVAHQGGGSDEIRDMFGRMLNSYPTKLLHSIGEGFAPNERKLEGVGRSGLIHKVPQRACKIKIGTAFNPDSCRGGDYNLVHLSEVGLWGNTEKRTPEQIVRSACAGVLLQPYTMIVYESTANGTGNFFQTEYDAAKRGLSQFSHLFISWFDIDLYSKNFVSNVERNSFAESLLKHRNNSNAPTTREESGKYLWWLWEKGATLEAINWYVEERKKCNDHAVMASEYPTDDVEAFVHSGAKVFDKYRVEDLRACCRPPRLVGEIQGLSDADADALTDIKFVEDNTGAFKVWSIPEVDDADDTYIANRYLVVVDIGGRSNKADFSVIAVFDRLFMMDGGKPSIVAQWRGHADLDIIAWKAAQIARWYDNALLVIEANTLESNDRTRIVDGDQSGFILNQIKDAYGNLYARVQTEEAIAAGLPRKYGFHTNTSTKPMVISALIKAVRESSYVERDTDALDELLCYEKRQNGSFGAIIGKHDDILMTRAIGIHICFYEMELPRIVSRKGNLMHRGDITEAVW